MVLGSSTGLTPALFSRAHWFLVVVCFPALEDVQNETFPSPTGETCTTNHLF